MKKVQDLYRESTQYPWDKLNKTKLNGGIYYVYLLEDSILERRSFPTN